VETIGKEFASTCKPPSCLRLIAILNLHASPHLAFKNSLKF